MKESLQRIGAWAKAHPALAVGIVVILGVVGYLLYKKAGGLTSSSSTTPAASDTSGATIGGGGTAPDLSALPLTDASYFTGGSVPPMATPPGDYAASPSSWSPTVVASITKSASETIAKNGGSAPAAQAAAQAETISKNTVSLPAQRVTGETGITKAAPVYNPSIAKPAVAK